MISKYTKNIVPYFFIAAAAFYMFQGIFAPGLMSGYDNSVHYSEAHYLVNTLLPKYHSISGWTMRAMAGCPILLHHPQTGFLLIAILNKAFFLPLELSYKIIVLFTYVFFGASFFKISSYRFGKVPALFMALCLMLQKDIYNDKILQGIWNNFLGMSLFFIFFHLLDKYVSNLTARRAAILGIILGLTVPTHLFAAAFSSLIFVIYLIPYISARPAGRTLSHELLMYMAIPLVALAVSLYYLQPFILARNYLSTQIPKDIYSGLAWSLKAFFGPLDKIGSACQLMTNLPVLARIAFSAFGLYAFLADERRENLRRFLNCVIVFTIMSLIIFSDILSGIFSAWQKIPLIGSLQTNRFLVYAQLGPYLFAAYGIARMLERIVWKRAVKTALLAILLPVILLHHADFAGSSSRTLEQSPYMADVRSVWDWVNKNISPVRSRVVYQNTVGNIDDPILNRSDIFALTSSFTDVPQLGVFLTATGFPQERYVRNDHGSIFDKPIAKIDAGYIGDMMNYFNADHIITVGPALEKRLEGSGAFLKEREFGPFSILRLTSFDGGWIKFTKDAKCENFRIDDQHAVFDIENNGENNTAYVKISYHPFWKAYLNGYDVTIGQDKYGLMAIPLHKTGDLRLELFFKAVHYPSMIVSIIGLILAISIITLFRKR